MSEAFTRTLETAAEAESIASLLDRSSEKTSSTKDCYRLLQLASKYREYAAALRACAKDATEPDPEQAALL